MSDIFYNQSPALWSVETLVSHGHQVVTDLARDAATSTTTMRYLLGRCMLAMDRLETYKEMGLSCSVHFATQHLKMNERLAKLVLKVTKQLEELPLLRQAALHGELEWSQIREVVSVATIETEEMWKELCLKSNCSQIQALVSATPKGGIPGEIASKLPRKTSEYRCRFQPEMVVLIEQCLQKMSRKLGKPIPFREAVERFFTEFLADKPYDEAAEKMLEEARKDFLAGRILQEPLVQKAREVAREVGILEDLQEVDLGESSCPEVLQQVSVQFERPEELGKDHAAAGLAERSSATALGKTSTRTGQERIEVATGLEKIAALSKLHRATELLGAKRDENSFEVTESLNQADSEEARKDESDPVNAHALVALENLQQAVGGDLPWELLDETGPADKEPTHVGNSNAEIRTESNIIEPDGSGPLDSTDCCKPHHPGQDNHFAEPSNRPTSKVTPLRTPFSEQKTRGHFELEAPTLLKELMARLKFNANSRFPTSAQRKALLRRDRYCCRTPGCTNHLFLEIHHIVRYSQGGKTLPRFLLTLCSRCHKHTEEGKLNIRLSETGEVVFTDQYGKNMEDVKRRERALWLDYWLGWKGRETDSHWARAVGFSQSVA